MRQEEALTIAGKNIFDDQAFLPTQFFMQKTGAKRLAESEKLRLCRRLG